MLSFFIASLRPAFLLFYDPLTREREKAQVAILSEPTCTSGLLSFPAFSLGYREQKENPDNSLLC